MKGSNTTPLKAVDAAWIMSGSLYGKIAAKGGEQRMARYDVYRDDHPIATNIDSKARATEFAKSTSKTYHHYTYKVVEVLKGGKTRVVARYQKGSRK